VDLCHDVYEITGARRLFLLHFNFHYSPISTVLPRRFKMIKGAETENKQLNRKLLHFFRPNSPQYYFEFRIDGRYIATARRAKPETTASISTPRPFPPPTTYAADDALPSSTATVMGGVGVDFSQRGGGKPVSELSV
jgi:hypothetical protein